MSKEIALRSVAPVEASDVEVVEAELLDGKCEGRWPECTGENVELVADPFEREMYDEIILTFLCDACYYQCQREI